MKKIKLSLLFLICLHLTGFAQETDKPVVIITQDGEVDDRSSFVRFLLYTSDIDLRGIIATNSVWQKNGHGLDWIHEMIDLYGSVRDNLLLHQPDYPTVAYLKSVTVRGNEDPEYLSGGVPYADSEGSDLIVAELLKAEDKPVHVNC